MMMPRPALTLALALALAACAGEVPEAASDTAAPLPTPTAGTTGATTADTMAAGVMLDPNTASRDQLAAAPGMTPQAADALVAARPLDGMLAVDRALAPVVADTAARKEIYRRVWIPLDLNTASRPELLLIPGAGPRMAHEFEEYRPYTDMARFRREIGKYVDQQEVARLERFFVIR